MCNGQVLQRDTDTPLPAPGAELTLAGLQYNFMMGDGTERWSDLCWTLHTRGGGWVALGRSSYRGLLWLWFGYFQFKTSISLFCRSFLFIPNKYVIACF